MRTSSKLPISVAVLSMEGTPWLTGAEKPDLSTSFGVVLDVRLAAGALDALDVPLPPLLPPPPFWSRSDCMLLQQMQDALMEKQTKR